jgi:hypothetical protein
MQSIENPDTDHPTFASHGTGDRGPCPPVSMMIYPGFNLLKLIIEDTAIDNTCHAKCQAHVISNNEDARIDALEHLNNTIEDIDNKHLYEQIISELVEYSLTIIDSNWDDYDEYEGHMRFLNEFLNNYYVLKPTLINFRMLPFGNLLPLTHQELILNYKFKQENKYRLRYQYLLNHINPVLDYLEFKLKGALYNCGLGDAEVF